MPHLTGVALDVREGVFLLTGEPGWNDIRNKVAIELGAQLKAFAFSHHCIQFEPPSNAEGKIQAIVGFFKNQITKSV